MAADPAARTTLARAKVNLTLHLCGQRADGYHLLDSLVVFPEIGDTLTVEPAHGLSMSLGGPFGDALSAGGDNLVLQVAERLAGGRALGAALHLEKNLPVASGIGGGSSDCAAAIGLLETLWGVTAPTDLALGLGADVPVCRTAPTAQRMQGIGEVLTSVPQIPDFWIVLVNPLVSVPTGAVFSGTTDKHPPAGPDMPPDGFPGFDALRGWLGQGRNDLQPAAAAVCHPITQVLTALADAPLARMSGSGATCFAIFPDQAPALQMADRLRAAEPWWVAAAPVTGSA